MLFESPTNPVTKIADIEHLTRMRARAGCLTVMDNTFAGFHNHGGFDIDIFLHSLTKYASGHGDVMGGAIIARRELIARMRKDIVLDGSDARSARGLSDPAGHAHLLSALRAPVRQRAGGEPLPRGARARQAGLLSGPRIHPQHALAAAANAGLRHGGELRSGRRLQEGNRFAEALEFFSIAASLGSTESLVMPPQLLRGQEYTPEQRAVSLIGRGTVRLSIGIEDAEDLLADLAQALDQAFA